MNRSTAAMTSLVLALALGASACPASYQHSDEAYFPANWKSDYAQISKCMKSDPHGDQFVVVYVNSASKTAWEMQQTPYPQGTVFLKAQHTDAQCANLDKWTVMRKGAAGTAPDAGDWEWQVVEADGSVKLKGKIKSCTGCHEDATDYVWTAP